MKVALLGATGMVGTEMLKVLEEQAFPVTELIPVASTKSIGKQLQFNGRNWTVCDVETAIARKPDIALFSAGGEFSKQFAPRFAEVGCRVIDNSSAWRMENGVPLIVPEINGQLLQDSDYIIANPNCSTIQLVMVLAPLQKAFGLRRVVISTYQSITGTGKKAVDQMEAERNGKESEAVYPHPIDRNCLPHCDSFLENGYTKEEMKLVNESRKILGLPTLAVTATAVRVPVVGGHSESVNIQLNSAFEIARVKELLSDTPGVIVEDDPAGNRYPMPLTAQGRDEVFVGRIRRDESVENGLNLWIVADNLRKGAATNAVQIAQYLVREKVVA